MGRPRLVRTKDGGEITCKNLTAEDVEKIQALFTDPLPISPVTQDTTFDDPEVATEDIKPYTAVGCYYAKGQWHVVRVNYNPDTKTAEVSNDETVGDQKVFAEERFRIEAVELNLV